MPAPGTRARTHCCLWIWTTSKPSTTRWVTTRDDLLLEQVAQRLKTCTRDGDTVARLGSDEFVVMLEDLSEDALEAATQAETVGDNILKAFVTDFMLDQAPPQHAQHRRHPVWGETLEGSEQPLKRAELAMFQAKAAGRNTLRFFDTQHASRSLCPCGPGG
jgi:GGDEF domain-containing protein